MLEELLNETYREERRIRLGRSKFTDIFFYSGVYDYRWLRVLVNFPIGFLIAFLLYQFAWHQINFADFDKIAEQILKWSLILACAVTFAISPLFRCAIICVLFGALGKNGQNLLTVIVFNSLSAGPMENIVQNFQVSTNMITCHIKQKENMITQRVVMATGPIESFMAKEFGEFNDDDVDDGDISSKSTSKGRKVIAMLKSLVEPIEYEFTLSDEDKALAATIDAAEALQRRDTMLNKEPEDAKEETKNKIQKSAVPAWIKLKSKVGLNLTKQKGKVNKCYSILWFLPLFRGHICDKFDTLQICQVSKKVSEAVTFCEQMTNEVLSRTKNLDTDLTDAYNLTQNVMDHLRVNVTLSFFSSLNEIILVTFKQILGCLFVLMIYTIFRDSVKMIRNYLSDIDFDNVYLTSYFWHIDCKRKNEGKIFLHPLSKAEMHANHLMTPISPPTKAEVRASWLPLAKFTFLLVTASFVVFVDSVFYRIIYNIDGTGFIADLVKEMLDFDYHSHRNTTFSLEECIYNPVTPDWLYAGKYIFFPLGIMFLLQVILGYVIRRITLFYVIGNIFRKRNKARIIHLYNKMLFVRINGRKLARARIRFQVQRRILQREEIRRKRLEVPVQANDVIRGTSLVVEVSESKFAAARKGEVSSLKTTFTPEDERETEMLKTPPTQ
ncbi:unnamed protein product [Litomosoides sigmodontis]|uniref:Dendritic cell-specific transmembrane protein-like domain-containing protein n=1 Tax=Litomosoides sigmodontis TaxID=42156 RepID=A0A3P6SIU7_LITSI|nr:unnamed protein product [Litomosoides sigmodontis]